MRAVKVISGILAVVLIVSAAPSASVNDCRCNGVYLSGRVKEVASHADFKVRVVDSHADLEVKRVNGLPASCGEWQFVENHPCFTVQFVDSHEDFRIKYKE